MSSKRVSPKAILRFEFDMIKRGNLIIIIVIYCLYILYGSDYTNNMGRININMLSYPFTITEKRTFQEHPFEKHTHIHRIASQRG
jgi:hypothetical protein